jgi:hypothetical protein
MGHYASEMNPPVRHDPDVLAGRRREERDGAAFRWQLYRQYEEQGEWIPGDGRLVCPTCFALVPAVLRADHEGWHSEIATFGRDGDGEGGLLL